MTDARLTVRLTPGAVMRLEVKHVELARLLSSVASERGAVADRGAVQEVQLAVASRPDEIDVVFWRAVLGYDPLAPDNGVDSLGHGSTFWVQELDPAKPLRHAMHVDVSVARECAEARVTAALAAGGPARRRLRRPEGWILADPAGNRVCVTSWPDGAPAQPPATGYGDEPGSHDSDTQPGAFLRLASGGLTQL